MQFAAVVAIAKAEDAHGTCALDGHLRHGGIFGAIDRDHGQGVHAAIFRNPLAAQILHTAIGRDAVLGGIDRERTRRQCANTLVIGIAAGVGPADRSDADFVRPAARQFRRHGVKPGHAAFEQGLGLDAFAQHICKAVMLPADADQIAPCALHGKSLIAQGRGVRGQDRSVESGQLQQADIAQLAPRKRAQHIAPIGADALVHAQRHALFAFRILDGTSHIRAQLHKRTGGNTGLPIGYGRCRYRCGVGCGSRTHNRMSRRTRILRPCRRQQHAGCQGCQQRPITAGRCTSHARHTEHTGYAGSEWKNMLSIHIVCSCCWINR